MLTEVKAGELTVRGISVGGVYTSLGLVEHGLLLDVGIPMRSLCSYDTWLLSHAHADHVGAMAASLGIRALQGKSSPPTVLMPAEVVDDLHSALTSLSKLQRWPLEINAVAMRAGDTWSKNTDVDIVAVQTFHPVPSLGYLVRKRTHKLKPEFAGLPGPNIAALRKQGVEVTEPVFRNEVGYATDTLVNVLDHSPALLECKALILECTFLDGRKSRDAARAGCHVHLDDLIERAELFANPLLQHVVLMHFSQLYRTDEVAKVLQARLPAELYGKVVPFCDETRPWFG